MEHPVSKQCDNLDQTPYSVAFDLSALFANVPQKDAKLSRNL